MSLVASGSRTLCFLRTGDSGRSLGSCSKLFKGQADSTQERAKRSGRGVASVKMDTSIHSSLWFGIVTEPPLCIGRTTRPPLASHSKRNSRFTLSSHELAFSKARTCISSWLSAAPGEENCDMVLLRQGPGPTSPVVNSRQNDAGILSSHGPLCSAMCGSGVVGARRSYPQTWHRSPEFSQPCRPRKRI